MKNKIIAICYDFDKTLSPRDMQEQGLFQDLAVDKGEFWKETDDMADSFEMDYNLAYMLMILKYAKRRGLKVTRDYLRGLGGGLELFPGLDKGEWFSFLNSYAREKGYEIEHYVLSSGLKEIIEGTCIYREFKKVYASEYYFDENNKEALWPCQVINYTNKTQFLFRIKKGLESSNSLDVNKLYKRSEIRIPFSHFIYIGDSETDIPCMKIINDNLGWGIGVYNCFSKDKEKVERLLKEKRIRLGFESDYRKDGELAKAVKLIIDKIYIDDLLTVDL